MKQGSIYRVKTDGTNRTQFAPTSIIGSPAGLAFNWINRMMYYTNPTAKSIEVMYRNFMGILNVCGATQSKNVLTAIRRISK